jgi:uncharacterized membrane protein
MVTVTATSSPFANYRPDVIKMNRVQSIDLLRGTVMIIMAIDHVRDYFHKSSFLYDPTNLDHTSVPIFFTRWITHFCAPVFMFLAGISSYLYGIKRTRKELSFFLFTRGIWLVFVELFIIKLGWAFNPSFHFFYLQVIWVIGISMIILSVMIYMKMRLILLTGILLIAAHNVLDTVHVPGNGTISFLWALLHEPGDFIFGNFSFFIRYPVLPWIGVLAAGYCFGTLYAPGYDAKKRKRTILYLGVGAIILFILLRSVNLYGDAAHWSFQKNVVFSFLSFLNVTKYPPSLLYILMTLGPALIFLAFTEKPLNAITAKISVFGRVPMFYYIVHIFLIHLFAIIGAVIAGYKWSDMVLLTNRVSRVQELKGYGFNLITVYIVWIVVIIILYPFCKWFDRYKKAHLPGHRWLSYL